MLHADCTVVLYGQFLIKQPFVITTNLDVLVSQFGKKTTQIYGTILSFSQVGYVGQEINIQSV